MYEHCSILQYDAQKKRKNICIYSVEKKTLKVLKRKKKQVTKFYKFLTLASSITIIAGIENGWHDK